jgi:hypothetical protein
VDAKIAGESGVVSKRRDAEQSAGEASDGLTLDIAYLEGSML